MTEVISQYKEYKLCSKCNQKPIYTNELCRKCDSRERYLAFRVCIDCNELKSHKKDGRCFICFRKWRCERAPKKLCECGCKELIPSITMGGNPARFKKGHSQRGMNNSFYGKRHSDEAIEKFKRRVHSSVNKRYTKPEKILEEELNNANIYFIIQKIFDIRDTIHPVDFFIPPNICIEVDGERWHTRLIHGLTGEINLNRDYIIDYELEKQGYRVLRFWESDVINNRQWVMNQILKMICKNYTINEWISCVCGCKQQLRKYDRWGRRRYFIQHHKQKMDRSNTFCLECGSNITRYNWKGSPMWVRKDDGYICKKCYDKNYSKRKKQILYYK